MTAHLPTVNLDCQINVALIDSRYFKYDYENVEEDKKNDEQIKIDLYLLCSTLVTTSISHSVSLRYVKIRGKRF